jgi:hypothetical protein
VVTKLTARGHFPMDAGPKVFASVFGFGSAQRVHIATNRRVQFLDLL